VAPLRLLCVVNGFAVGGGELKVLELTTELRRLYPNRYRIVAAAVGQGGQLEERFKQAADRIEVIEKKHPYDVSQVARLWRLIREEKIDVVQTTLFYADVIGTLAARFAGVTHIVSWEAITQPYGPKHRLAYRLAAKGFRVSVSVSEAIRRMVEQDRHVPRSKTRTIRYGVDVRKFRPSSGAAVRGALGIPSDRLVLGTVARLTEQKGHTFLIRAVPAVVSRFPNVTFLFAGDGPLRERLEAEAGSLGILKAVRFLGFRSDVAELLSCLDAFVLPSLYEGLPNVVLEAMACGKPVVATAVDGTPEAVKDGVTGLLVPPRDPGALAEAILRLARNPGLRRSMGAAARQKVLSEHRLEGQVEAFHALYSALLQT
jgi:glycosyltransferase involved in cell wall biosynthesis